MIIALVILILVILNRIKAEGFDYPDRMPSPHEIIVYNNLLYGYVTNDNKLETPLVVRFAHIGTVGAWNCVAQYDPNALDVNTLQRPIVDELPDDQYLNSYTRSLCLQHVYVKIMHQIYPPMVPYYTGLFTLWGLDNIDPEVDQTVIDCNHNKTCLTQLARDNGFYPSFMANIIAYEATEYFRNDGWNADGSLNSQGECTANCKPFIDTTGYEPKVEEPKKNGKKLDKNKGKKRKKGSESRSKSDDQETCGDNDNWVPLLETNYYGFFYKHEHVTPHIGIKGKPFLFTKYKEADPPNYDYDEESELLLERLRILAVNDTQKAMVEFFDNKLIVRGMIGLALLRQYPDALTYENFVNYVIGISLTEHDTLLTAWNQKVKYDKIRPTTVIQRRGNELITTYGGPYQGIKTFEAKDFEPYIRIMPHSEYPSGSACLCIGYMEFVQKFVKEEFNDTELYNLVWYRGQGSSKVEPGATPSQPMLLEIYNMTELYETCSESRLWGGMHFTTSIHAAKEICSGIGTKGYEYAYKLKENSNFSGSAVASDSGIDLEEVWLPGLKAIDFLVYHFSFSALLSGNINFDPDILKLITLIIPGIDLSDIAQDMLGLLGGIMINLESLFQGVSPLSADTSPEQPDTAPPPEKEPAVAVSGAIFKDNEFINKTIDTLSGIQRVWLICFVGLIAITCLVIGIYIGTKVKRSEYQTVQWKSEQEI